MIPELRSALLRKASGRFFYGWAILGVAGLGIFASGPGQSHTFSVFVGPIGEDLGLSGTAISLSYGLATLAAAFGLPYVGRRIDRYGARRMLLVVAVGLGFACLFFGAAANLLWLGVGFALLRVLGQGSLMLGCVNLVSQWFERRRGFAMSLMALGFSVSMAIHPPLSQWLIETVGWRQAWLWLGLATWLLLLPPLILVVHNQPESVGLRPDGAAAPAKESAPPAISGLAFGEALRTPAFYIIAAGLFSMSMLVTALHFFQVSIFAAQGLSRQVAAQVFTVSALSMVVAMPFIGRMLDSFRTERMFAAGLLVMATSLALASLVDSLAMALVYAAVFGVNNAVTMTYFGYLWPRYFGRRHLGSIQGAGQMVGVVGASLGPLPFGLAYDITGSFAASLLAFSALPLGLSVVALFLRDPKSGAAQE
jgi:MFS family permease